MTELASSKQNPSELITPFFEVPVVGSFSRNEVIVEDSLQTMDKPGVVQRRIDENWQRRLLEVEERGGRLDDLPTVALLGWEVKDGKLHVRLGRTSYREFVGTFDADFRKDYPQYVTRILAAGAVVETIDHFLIVNQRSQTVFKYPGWISSFGGAAEEQHVNESGDVDPFVTILEELNQETLIPKDRISEIKCLGFIKNPDDGVCEMAFWAKTDLTKGEIQMMQSQAFLEEGPSVFIPITPEEIQKKILRFSKIFVFDGAATLALWGREKFGDKWFQFIIERLNRRGAAYASMTEEQRKILEERIIMRAGRIQ